MSIRLPIEHRHRVAAAVVERDRDGALLLDLRPIVKELKSFAIEFDGYEVNENRDHSIIDIEFEVYPEDGTYDPQYAKRLVNTLSRKFRPLSFRWDSLSSGQTIICDVEDSFSEPVLLGGQ